jgi:hypothetical protein
VGTPHKTDPRELRQKSAEFLFSLKLLSVIALKSYALTGKIMLESINLTFERKNGSRLHSNATGCHSTGPLALRHRLSPALPYLVFC